MIARILSIDGGGIRGILPARLLAELERRSGRRAAELFDLIAGTSTGGILACGIARRIDAASLGDLYAAHGGEIFSRSMSHMVATAGGVLGAKYDPAPLEAMLRQVLGDAWLAAVEKPHLLVPSYAIALPRPTAIDGTTARSLRAPLFFKSWKANGGALDAGERADAFDFPLWQVARATSAAPTYFPPADIESRSGERYAMIDGGVFANNPSLCALASARRLFPEAERFLLVSLGTGAAEAPIDARKAREWGDVEWLRPILAVLVDGAVDTVCYIADRLLGGDHQRFEAAIADAPDAPDAAFDEASAGNIHRLESLALRMIAAEGGRLDRLCRLLGA
jgi:patatin-like phospholipase/acyl hydrolase